jgi:hypothetical protein
MLSGYLGSLTRLKTTEVTANCPSRGWFLASKYILRARHISTALIAASTIKL